MLNDIYILRFIERNEWKERKVRLERPVCCIFAAKKIKHSCFASDRRSSERLKVTGDEVTAKTIKSLPAYVRTYA